MGEKLFVLRYKLSTGTVYIHVWEGSSFSSCRTQLNLEVRQNRKVIFPKGQLFCSPGPQHSIDGKAARELASSCVAMKPGDTDFEFFEGYSEEQLAWARANGEELRMLREWRYCNPETGELRKS